MNLFTTERNNCRRRLIMLVKKHPIIWNKQEEDYKRNRHRKMQTWYAIAKEMNSSTDKIRRTWENLRDQYRRDLKREMKYGYTSKWRFFSDMEFIRHMVNCKESQIGMSDSDSEMEANELRQQCPRERIISHESQLTFSTPPVIRNEMNSAFTSASVAEFQPIILSKQWQQTHRHDDNERSNHSEYYSESNAHIENRNTQEVIRNLSPAPANNNNTNTRNLPIRSSFSADVSTFCSAALKLNRNEPVNYSAAASIDLEEEVTKHEPALDIVDIEEQQLSTALTLDSQLPQESENFQESYVSTSSPKIIQDLNIQQTDLNITKSSKKLKISDSEILDCKDEDYHFVMSLLPSLRQIPGNKKLGLRIGILNLIATSLEDVCK